MKGGSTAVPHAEAYLTALKHLPMDKATTFCSVQGADLVQYAYGDPVGHRWDLAARCLPPDHRLWTAASSSPTRRPHHAAFAVWRLPRPPSSHRRASDVAVSPRSRPRGAPGQARLRRILVRRAPF